MKQICISIVLCLVSLFGAQRLAAQMMLGNSGGFNAPTADINEAGTFSGGLHFIGKGLITPENDVRSDGWKFQYNTFTYYGTFAVYDWLEATFRETLIQNTWRKKKPALREQDRSVAVKVRLLKEGDKWPAIAVGINDPTSVTGHHPFACGWVAATKNVHLRSLAGTVGLTAGYMKSWDLSIMYDGLTCNLRYRPDFFPQASAMLEYDTKGLNYGVEALLWRHLGVYAFGRELETWSAGIRYQTTIKYRKK